MAITVYAFKAAVSMQVRSESFMRTIKCATYVAQFPPESANCKTGHLPYFNTRLLHQQDRLEAPVDYFFLFESAKVPCLLTLNHASNKPKPAKHFNSSLNALCIRDAVDPKTKGEKRITIETIPLSKCCGLTTETKLLGMESPAPTILAAILESRSILLNAEISTKHHGAPLTCLRGTEVTAGGPIYLVESYIFRSPLKKKKKKEKKYFDPPLPCRPPKRMRLLAAAALQQISSDLESTRRREPPSAQAIIEEIPSSPSDPHPEEIPVDRSIVHNND
ncbi:hypothetical protein K491DRAFT_685713 [Lophiostoma macrostomum CBS 122681]|uniref:Uncharacterized protein n=1 Tax=Lophiostoma macrostomum CBS 122681 TaxID=1314788 RepID=A0A6A6SM18_9PLEO|nr:hypothetical protein K491DRAFT_685713 [Lophiostoma macrostomum CBS 122681]